MGRTPALMLFVLAACGMSEARFQVEGVEQLCEEISACTGHVEVEACVDEVRAVDRSGCEYDHGSAAACLELLEDAACVTHAGTGRSTLEIPEICAEVYPGCDALYEEPYEPAF